MAKIGEILSSGFKIWESHSKERERKSFEKINRQFDKRKNNFNDNNFDSSDEKMLNKIPYVKITKFPRCWTSKNVDVRKTTPENTKISIEIPKAPTKLLGKTEKKFDAIPKRLRYPESEDEYEESIDRSVLSSNVNNDKNYYSSRAKQHCKIEKETEKKIEAKDYNMKPKSESKKNNDKENNFNFTQKTQRKETSTNKKILSKFIENVEASKKDTVEVASKENIKPMTRRLSTCQSADRKEHLLWLQPRRNVGVWIECCQKKCRKWRYVENYRDPVDVPKVWYCEMNNDKRFASCAVPEQESQDDFIMNAYNAGSIVWARLNGYPWWPAMVDDCPKFLRFYETHGKSKVPQKYHVIFFNKKIETAWIPVKDIKPYAENPRNSFLKKTKFGTKNYLKQLNVACKWADESLPLTIPERLKRFSFVSRISDDKKTQARIKKRQAVQRLKSLGSKVSTATNDKAKISKISEMPLSTSTDEILMKNWIDRQKNSNQRKDIECITIEESEKHSCDTQNKNFLISSEQNSKTPRASVSDTREQISNNVPSLPNYSFLPKPFSRYEHLLITKILDFSAELKKLREPEGDSMPTDNRDRTPMEIDNDSSNNFRGEKCMPRCTSNIIFNESSTNSRSNSPSDYEETKVKINMNVESLPIVNHESRSVNNRSSVIVFGADPHFGKNGKNYLSSNKELEVITID